MKKYAAIAAFASLFVVACNPPAGDPTADKNNDGIADPTGVRGVDVVNQQAPSAPVGNIIGILLDAYTGAPIAKQDINVQSGRGVQLKTTTDDSGAFLVASIAFGDFGISIVKDGYIPVNTVMNIGNGGNLGFFPTDNFVIDEGQIYLLPNTSSIGVSVTTQSGFFAANKQIIVDVASAFQVFGTTPNAGSSVLGQFTTVATTDAQGVAVITGTPDPVQLSRILVDGDDYAVTVTSGPVDVDGDGLFDFAGRSGNAYPNGTYAADGRAKFSFVLSPAQANTAPTVTASNLSDQNATRPAAIGTGDALHVVFDQPILGGSVVAAVTNDFPRDTGAARAYDNSSIGFDREANPEPAYAYSTGNNTLTPTLDQSGQALTLTGSTAWPAGRMLHVTLMVSSQQRSGGASNSQLFDLFAFVKPAADPLTVEQTLVERAKTSPANGFKYSNLVFGFNQAVVAASNGFYACIDADLNNNGSRETNFVLDRGECPDAASTRGLNTADVANLFRFKRADGGTTPPASRWYMFSLQTGGPGSTAIPAFPNLDLNGGVAALPDMYILINPIVNGTFQDPGTTEVTRDALLRPLQSQRVKANIDVAKSTLSQVAVGSTALIANNQ